MICVKTAARERSDTKVITFRTNEELVLRDVVTDEDNPATICICLGGNDYNIIGTLEHRVPFSIGEKVQGATSMDPERQFIPYQAMRDQFRRSLTNKLDLAQEIFARFPAAKRICLCPPPPIGDWEHIQRRPGMFGDKLALGPAPDALRLQLYQIYVSCLHEMAAELGAEVVEPPPVTRTDDGFLRPEFYSSDPTHGNAQYGRIVLDLILASAKAAA